MARSHGQDDLDDTVLAFLLHTERLGDLFKGNPVRNNRPDVYFALVYPLDGLPEAG